MLSAFHLFAAVVTTLVTFEPVPGPGPRRLFSSPNGNRLLVVDAKPADSSTVQYTLHDEHGIIYSVAGPYFPARVVVADTGWSLLAVTPSSPSFHFPTRDSALFGQRFDFMRLSPRGESSMLSSIVRLSPGAPHGGSLEPYLTYFKLDADQRFAWAAYSMGSRPLPDGAVDRLKVSDEAWSGAGDKGWQSTKGEMKQWFSNQPSAAGIQLWTAPYGKNDGVVLAIHELGGPVAWCKIPARDASPADFDFPTLRMSVERDTEKESLVLTLARPYTRLRINVSKVGDTRRASAESTADSVEGRRDEAWTVLAAHPKFADSRTWDLPELAGNGVDATVNVMATNTLLRKRRDTLQRLKWLSSEVDVHTFDSDPDQLDSPPIVPWKDGFGLVFKREDGTVELRAHSVDGTPLPSSERSGTTFSGARLWTNGSTHVVTAFYAGPLTVHDWRRDDHAARAVSVDGNGLWIASVRDVALDREGRMAVLHDAGPPFDRDVPTWISMFSAEGECLRTQPWSDSIRARRGTLACVNGEVFGIASPGILWIDKSGAATHVTNPFPSWDHQAVSVIATQDGCAFFDGRGRSALILKTN